MALDTGPMVSGFGNATGFDSGMMGAGPSALPQESLLSPAFTRTSFDMTDFAAADSLGAGLRAAREFKGLSVVEVAEMTRVRRVYLLAIEAMQFSELPSRPFALGYVRAYAAALGLDEGKVIERFRLEVPDQTGPLRAPTGMQPQSDPRVRIIAVAAMVMFGAVLVWNIVQRGLQQPSQPAPTVPDLAVAASGLPASHRPEAKAGTVTLAEPLPAPAESNLPDPYVTPGLAEATAAGGSVDAAQAAAKAVLAAEKASGIKAAAVVADVRVGAAFNARGVVYGAAPQQSVVTIQARKGASIIIRGADGAVYFARQLAAGEAYRAPMVAGLTLDVSDPAAFDVFVNGELTGQPPAPLTPLAHLGNVAMTANRPYQAL